MKTIKITATSHPKLYQACKIIYKEVQHIMPTPKMPEELTLNAAYDVDRCERALAKLSEDQLHKFAIGEEEFRFELIYGDPDLEYCDAVLTEHHVGMF